MAPTREQDCSRHIEEPEDEVIQATDGDVKVFVASSPSSDVKDFSDIEVWILKMLQEAQPDAEITAGSLKVLSALLDSLTTKVLDEAKKISEGELRSEDGSSSSCNKQPSPLTTLDINKALKRLLPGEPGDPLRPYLPTVTKQAWHMDKQSFKGIKSKKQKVDKGAS